MKITAGLGSVDDYISYVKAGASECFCGYVPHSYMEHMQGLNTPLNRREVLYYNVQIGSKSEMEILAEQIKDYKVPVTITLNSLYYTPNQYDYIYSYILECYAIGFCSFILADFSLYLYLHTKSLPEDITFIISGEIGEMNHCFFSLLPTKHLSRIIFHRKMQPKDMKQFASYIEENHQLHLEYEAFALNEKCHFHGGYCNSLHCDALVHSCQLPYRLSSETPPDAAATFCHKEEAQTPSTNLLVPGATGCGLCALYELREAGITHLKLVSRGNYSEDTISDIGVLKKALLLLEESHNKEEYVSLIKKELFSDACSHNCYYYTHLPFVAPQ